MEFWGNLRGKEVKVLYYNTSYSMFYCHNTILLKIQSSLYSELEPRVVAIVQISVAGTGVWIAGSQWELLEY